MAIAVAKCYSGRVSKLQDALDSSLPETLLTAYWWTGGPVPGTVQFSEVYSDSQADAGVWENWDIHQACSVRPVLALPQWLTTFDVHC